MPADTLFACPYHETKEVVPGVPYLLECGCKCMQSFDKQSEAERAAEEEGGQVVEHVLDGKTKYIVVIYIPTAIQMPK